MISFERDVLPLSGHDLESDFKKKNIGPKMKKMTLIEMTKWEDNRMLGHDFQK